MATTDTERMDRRSRRRHGVAPARCRPAPGWEPWSCRPTTAEHPGFAGATQGRSRPPRRGRGAGRGRPRPRPAPRSTPRSSRARTTAAPGRARRRSSTPVSPGSSSAWSIPTPRWQARASRPGRAPASRSRSASRADEVERQLAPYLDAPPHRPSVRRAQAGRDARRAHRRPGRHRPVDHRAPRPASTPTACGPTATPSLVGAGTVRADDPAPHRPAPRRRAGRGLRPAPAGRPRPGARGGEGAPALELDGSPAEVLDELGRRGVAAAAGRGRRRRGPRTSTRPGWSTATSSTWRRRSSVATTPAACSPAPACRPSPTSGGGASTPSPARAPTCASIWCPVLGMGLRPPIRARPRRPDDVHRNRRGARLGRLARRRRLRIDADTVLDDVAMGDSIAVNGCCLTVVAWGTDDGRRGGRPTSSTRPTPAPAWGPRPGDPVNLERPVRLEDRLGGHLVQGHVDARRQIVDRRARPAGPHAARAAPLRGREGLDHRRRRQPDRGRAARRRLHRRPHPPHRRGHHPRAQGPRATR